MLLSSFSTSTTLRARFVPSAPPLRRGGKSPLPPAYYVAGAVAEKRPDKFEGLDQLADGGFDVHLARLDQHQPGGGALKKHKTGIGAGGRHDATGPSPRDWTVSL